MNACQPRRQVNYWSSKRCCVNGWENMPQRCKHLRAALALAEPRGLIRTFVDAGPGVEPLLKTVAARPDTLCDALLAVFRRHVIVR